MAGLASGRDKGVLCYDWLPERTGRAYLVCTGSPDLSRGKTLILFSLFIKQACSVKMTWVKSIRLKGPRKTKPAHRQCTAGLVEQASFFGRYHAWIVALCCKQVETDNETKAKIPHVSVDWSVDVQQWSKGNAKESAFKERGLEVTRCSLTTLRKFWLHISRYSLHCLGFRLANGDNNGLKVLW